MLAHVPEGTRVVVLKNPGRKTGVVAAVRHESYLKPYAVNCDDGTQIYASAWELAREDDPSATPLGPAVARE